MFSALLMNKFYGNIIETAVVLVMFSLVYLALYFFILRKMKGRKTVQQYRVRTFYIICFLALIFIAKIWVEGFLHILALLSLVSAALVITNKELVMNFVGWLIINWRGLFSEGDMIKMQNYYGFVHEIGILYFKVLEISENSYSRSSGRMIKIPNGFIINNALINFSQQTNFIEYVQKWIVTPTSDLKGAKEILEIIAKNIIQKYYDQEINDAKQTLHSRNYLLAELIDLKIHIGMELKQDQPIGMELILSYYCFPKDKDSIDEEIKREVFHAFSTSKSIQLSYSS